MWVTGSRCQVTVFRHRIPETRHLIRGLSSVGRAHPLHGWGQGFESPSLHHRKLLYGVASYGGSASSTFLENFAKSLDLRVIGIVY